MQRRLLALLAAAGAIAVLSLAFNPGFYNHDELMVLHRVQGGTWFSWNLLTDGSGLFYRPLGYVAFHLQFALMGDSPRAVHALSVLHHFANVWLFAMLLRQLHVSGPAVQWALLLPVAIPGIAWVAAVYDRLAVTWLLLAAMALAGGGRRAWWCLGWFALALLTKESAIAFLVPMWCLLLARGPECPARAGIGALVTAMAAGFAIWRLSAGASVVEYAFAWRDAPVRLARHGAFCFALGAEDPRTVWGWRWLGALGMAALAWLGWRGDRRLAAVGVLAFLAPLALVCGLPRVEGHYLYPAAPGLTLLALAAVRASGRWARLLVAALGVTAVLHGTELAIFYHRAGAVMDSLVRAHASAPTAPDIDLVCEPGSARWLAERFVVHVERSHLRPLPRLCAASAATNYLVLDTSGVAHLHTRP